MKPKLILPEDFPDREKYVYVPRVKKFVNPFQVFNGIPREEIIRAISNREDVAACNLGTFIPYKTHIRKAFQGIRPAYNGAGEQAEQSYITKVFENSLENTHIQLNDLLVLQGKYDPEKDKEATFRLLTNKRSKKLKVGRDVSSREFFVRCLMRDGFVNLDHRYFNQRGLPKKLAKTDEIIPGRNIWYEHPDPENGRVPIYEGGLEQSLKFEPPGETNNNLGVLLVAKGTQKID